MAAHGSVVPSRATQRLGKELARCSARAPRGCSRRGSACSRSATSPPRTCRYWSCSRRRTWSTGSPGRGYFLGERLVLDQRQARLDEAFLDAVSGIHRQDLLRPVPARSGRLVTQVRLELQNSCAVLGAEVQHQSLVGGRQLYPGRGRIGGEVDVIHALLGRALRIQRRCRRCRPRAAGLTPAPVPQMLYGTHPGARFAPFALSAQTTRAGLRVDYTAMAFAIAISTRRS